MGLRRKQNDQRKSIILRANREGDYEPILVFIPCKEDDE